jgi:hypothetical protein
VGIRNGDAYGLHSTRLGAAKAAVESDRVCSDQVRRLGGWNLYETQSMYYVPSEDYLAATSEVVGEAVKEGAESAEQGLIVAAEHDRPRVVLRQEQLEVNIFPSGSVELVGTYNLEDVNSEEVVEYNGRGVCYEFGGNRLQQSPSVEEGSEVIKEVSDKKVKEKRPSKKKREVVTRPPLGPKMGGFH